MNQTEYERHIADELRASWRRLEQRQRSEQAAHIEAVAEELSLPVRYVAKIYAEFWKESASHLATQLDGVT